MYGVQGKREDESLLRPGLGVGTLAQQGWTPGCDLLNQEGDEEKFV